MIAVALPIALLLGLLTDVVSGLVSWPLGGERRWWRRATAVGTDLRSAFWTRDSATRPAVAEAGGALAALLGSSLAAAAAVGLVPGNLVLLYLVLVLAAAGAHVVAVHPPTASGEPAAGRARLEAVLAEPAFVVGLGVLFLRYGAFDLSAARGTQEVLGPGLVLRPGLAAAGLAVAATVVVASAALRMPPVPERGRRVGAPKVPAGAAAVLIRVSRWALAGATAMVLSVLVAGRELVPFEPRSALLQVGIAAAVAVVLGAAEALLRRLPDRWRLVAGPVALLVAAGAAVMVVMG